ncbi:tetratricopeptide repeat protein [Marinobacterium aestuariivivens]|uniref:Tetratricopeptide repeat protein n=1 Tax=Marinobacterium aestuariivivens TaxID=1698799 RepID=A0ABW1ZUJ1_9GAMM
MLISRLKLLTGLKTATKVAFLGGVLAFSSYSLGDCGSVYDEKYGPYDYTDERQRARMLGTVERRHFTEKVRSLNKGGETGSIMGDIGYTLRKFPNHYPALMTLVKYSDYETVKYDPFVQEKIDCFFVRAIEFKPSDHRVYHIYGIYLFGKEDYKASIENYRKALDIEDSAEVHYNIGLAYLKVGDIKSAEFHAAQAYKKGYPLSGLKNLLLDQKVSNE